MDSVWTPTVIIVDDARSANPVVSATGTESARWTRTIKTRYQKISSNQQIATILGTYGQDKYKLAFLLEKHNVKVDMARSRNADSSYYSRIQIRQNVPNPARDNGQAQHLHYHLREAIKSSRSFPQYTDV